MRVGREAFLQYIQHCRIESLASPSDVVLDDGCQILARPNSETKSSIRILRYNGTLNRWSLCSLFFVLELISRYGIIRPFYYSYIESPHGSIRSIEDFDDSFCVDRTSISWLESSSEPVSHEPDKHRLRLGFTIYRSTHHRK